MISYALGHGRRPVAAVVAGVALGSNAGAAGHDRTGGWLLMGAGILAAGWRKASA